MLNTILNKIEERLLRRFKGKIDHSAFKLAVQSLFNGISRPIVLDLGAHHGETIELFNSEFGNLTMYCFEPFPDSYINLELTAKKFPYVKTYCCGMSNVAGEHEFNSNIGSPTNSLLNLDERAITTWSNSALAPKQKIKCKFTTIDDFVKSEQINNVDLLKIDVQGAEYLVLEGGHNTLKNGIIKSIFMEVIIGPTYQNQWELVRYLDFLASYNYYLKGFYNLTYDRQGSVIQLDALFTIREQ